MEMLLTLLVRGGHRVTTTLPADLSRNYNEDPLKFGRDLERTLDMDSMYVVEDIHGRRVFVRSANVMGWEVNDVAPGLG